MYKKANKLVQLGDQFVHLGDEIATPEPVVTLEPFVTLASVVSLEPIVASIPQNNINDRTTDLFGEQVQQAKR
jgi:hypothetical protein